VPIALLFVGVLAIAPTLPSFGLRPDAGTLGAFWLWAPSALEALFGLVLIGLALREAVPGLGVSPRAIGAGVAAAFALQALVAWSTHVVSPGPAFDPATFWLGSACARTEALLGIPAVLLTLWLVARAYPLRPERAGLLGGVGAGLFADGVQHLHCPLSDLRHVLVFHAGGMLGLALLGWLFGLALGSYRRSRGADYS
jgi:hypothetical protein